MPVAANHSRRNPEPDYKALIPVLMYHLHRLLDPLGETILTRSEAKLIRACGFEARANCRWRSPLLPDALVRNNPLLEHMSVSYNSSWRPRGWNPVRAKPLHRYEPPALTTIEQTILNLLRNAPLGQLAKRTLQQRLWRLPARFINHALSSLALKGYLQWTGPLIYTFGTSHQG